MSTPVLLVQGTHAWGRTDPETEWWSRRSPFAQFLTAEGCTVLGGDRPYVWDTDLDGVGFLSRTRTRHINWEAAGLSLYAYLRPPLRANFDDYVPLADRNLIAHSHALQVVAYACARGLIINRLVTIGAPVREDMAEVYAAARPHIGAWWHVHSDASDRIQWLGTLFDGHLGIVRAHPRADRNVAIPKVSHSKLVNDQRDFPLWDAYNLLPFLRGEMGDAARD